MVRMPGSSDQDDVKIKIEVEDEQLVTAGPSPAYALATGSDGPQNVGTTATVKEEMQEEKAPTPVPVEAPPGASVDLGASRDPPTPSLAMEPLVSLPRVSAGVVTSRPASVKKRPTRKTTKKKLKAPGTDEDKKTSADEAKAMANALTSYSEAELEYVFCRQELFRAIETNAVLKQLRLDLPNSLTGPVTEVSMTTIARGNKPKAVLALTKLLSEAGFVSRGFEAPAMLDFTKEEIAEAISIVYPLLHHVIGVKVTEDGPQRPTREDPGSTGTSQYHSASSASVQSSSNESESPKRMTLGPSGARMLQSTTFALPGQTPWPRPVEAAKPSARDLHATTTPFTPANVPVPTRAGSANNPYSVMEVQRMIENAIAQQNAPDQRHKAMWGAPSPVPLQTSQQHFPHDIDMESVASRDPRLGDYPADDLDLFADFVGSAGRSPTIATNAAVETSAGPVTTRLRVSAISELKEFSGRDNDEEKARTWFNKVRSAGRRDQASNEEMCLVFGDLLVGAARSWYSQLSRHVRRSWPDLSDKFMVQYCGKGVSVSRKYYQARQRSNETPTEYLHRLNVAGIRAKLHIMDGDADERREHVVHFIKTLEDTDLARQFGPLRLKNVEDLEDVLRDLQQLQDRQRKDVGNKPRPPKPQPTTANARAIRATRVVAVESDKSSDEDDYDDLSEEEAQVAKIFLAAKESIVVQQPEPPKHEAPPRDDSGDRRCSHCGSTRHSDLGCWQRLTCLHCGKRGHPSDRCLYLCKGCNKIHEAGECKMAELYDLMRQWYDPEKHVGLLPVPVEKMLN